MLPGLEQGWIDVIGDEFDKPYMAELKAFLKTEQESGLSVYPKEHEIFRALDTTPFENVHAVILGQDPYHGEGQAHGLAFSVRKGTPIPPSLMNIYKEIEAEFCIQMPPHGDLSRWAEQGVLLLNATLTVQQAKAGSHQKKGWENFTDAIIRALNEKRDHVVFMLWGAYAQKKGEFIDRERHLVLETAHPSPLSAYRGFLGCGHFRKTNEYLTRHGQKPIQWGDI